MEERSGERYLSSYRALPEKYSQLIFDGLEILEET